MLVSLYCCNLLPKQNGRTSQPDWSPCTYLSVELGVPPGLRVGALVGRVDGEVAGHARHDELGGAVVVDVAEAHAVLHHRTRKVKHNAVPEAHAAQRHFADEIFLASLPNQIRQIKPIQIKSIHPSIHHY